MSTSPVKTQRKILILTQPLRHNYGGVLQAYALQKVLRKMGHQVWTEDRLSDSTVLKRSISVRVKNFIYFLVKKRRWIISDLVAFRSSTHGFIKSNIRLTPITRSNTKENLLKYGFDTYIVGSDQVWRPVYSPFLYNYFLDFTKDINVKRIAYAASFGSDEWEFTSEQTSYCASLLKKFDAVSVREKTAVRLCEKHFDVEAVQTLDPTLLLKKEDYLPFVQKVSSKKGEKYVTGYILDADPVKWKIMSEVSNKLQYKENQIAFFPDSQNKKQDSYLSIEDWLSQIYHASFVVTDSFHGCVFAILFNKPFVAIENAERGSTRFYSLFDLLGLQDRLVNSYDDFLRKKEELLFSPINYEQVNATLGIERTDSIRFLQCALASTF